MGMFTVSEISVYVFYYELWQQVEKPKLSISHSSEVVLSQLMIKLLKNLRQ